MGVRAHKENYSVTDDKSFYEEEPWSQLNIL